MIRKLQMSMFGLPLMAAVVVLLGVGCSKKPTDAALATNVQKKITADSSLTAQPISVAASSGIVTLSGTVGDQNMRDAAAKDAAEVDGVRTVVNNLNVAGGANANEASPNSEAPQGEAGSAPLPPPASAAPPAQAAAPQPIVVPAGTRIRVRLGQTLSTKENQTGDPFSGSGGGFGAGEWADCDSSGCAGEGSGDRVQGPREI